MANESAQTPAAGSGAPEASAPVAPTGPPRFADVLYMAAADLQTERDQLERRFREWVRKGMAEPAPSFDALRDNADYLPADVIEILASARGLSSFWNYGQAVRQLKGEPPTPDLPR